MNELIQLKRFSEINLGDSFFNSLKEDYKGFVNWFKNKADENAFILESEDGIEAFLYLKVEKGPVTDVTPYLDDHTRVKIGTMKINPHGTRLGERFIKKAFDFAVSKGLNELYVTVFPKHDSLINIYKQYGFIEHGKKITSDGEELVLVKSFSALKGNVILDYPVVINRNVNKYLLAIYPEFHTRLFPDSILRTERFDVIEDVSHTNSIHKAYISYMEDVSKLNAGDVLVIYRTKERDDPGPAEYRSVATSVCVVEEIKSKKDFKNRDDFVKYCMAYSVFSNNELIKWYMARKPYLYVIRMTYNIAMTKRLTRGQLIKDCGIERNAYWGFIQLADRNFNRIIEMGGINESLIVN
ncbi:hypothetical protein DCCM_3071 [Desulfocucumis palustris]|uniref:N-acetyltransferase domain-containing protein n=1 Tax=Desulfocucumis palustris TaxID=1898651 RepID=A0A2L2XCT9_9FIRM|nr:N-acetyltransferase [Desulfocucumis palustris]GBF33960.1 hypothetical protein DCCM_3071 [Desulfocucumis palustris]